MLFDGGIDKSFEQNGIYFYHFPEWKITVALIGPINSF